MNRGGPATTGLGAGIERGFWSMPTKPAKSSATCRMFESDLIERFSRIHPITPFVAWVPAALFVIYRSAARHDLPYVGVAGMVLLGVLAWTLAEYVLHRYVFHWRGTTPAGRRIHFLLHGVHHDFPNDGERLVMPLGFSIPLSVVFYSLFYAALGGVRLSEPFFAGFVLGYLAYDGTHYAVHHFKTRTRLGKWVKRHHMLHHHMDHHGGFGVSSPLWDVVFRTMPRVKAPRTPTKAAPGTAKSA